MPDHHSTKRSPIPGGWTPSPTKRPSPADLSPEEARRGRLEKRANAEAWDESYRQSRVEMVTRWRTPELEARLTKLREWGKQMAHLPDGDRDCIIRVMASSDWSLSTGAERELIVRTLIAEVERRYGSTEGFKSALTRLGRL